MPSVKVESNGGGGVDGAKSSSSPSKSASAALAVSSWSSRGKPPTAPEFAARKAAPLLAPVKADRDGKPPGENPTKTIAGTLAEKTKPEESTAAVDSGTEKSAAAAKTDGPAAPPPTSQILPPPSDSDPPLSVLAAQLRVGDPSWLRRYQELLRYLKLHGHVDVPRLHSANLPLASWVHNMRKDHKRYVQGHARTNMTREKAAALEKIGFTWDLHGAMWDRRFDELREFGNEHGHVDVPQRYSANPSLGRWVNTQRLQQRLRSEGKKSDMTPERYAKLDELGMVWYVKGPEQWNVRFDELIEYRREFADCNVPSRYAPNRKLGRWVSFQRTQYRLRGEGRHNHLTEERIRKLEDIGFSWTGVTTGAAHAMVKRPAPEAKPPAVEGGEKSAKKPRTAASAKNGKAVSVSGAKKKVEETKEIAIKAKTKTEEKDQPAQGDEKEALERLQEAREVAAIVAMKKEGSEDILKGAVGKQKASI